MKLLEVTHQQLMGTYPIREEEEGLAALAEEDSDCY